MKRISLLALLLLVPVLQAQNKEDGYQPLFNGKDLQGWVNVNCAAGTFFVKDQMIITNGNPTGYLRTDKQYENFILELEWKHINKEQVGNSGLFIWADPLPAVGTGYTRGIEVQVLVNYPKTDWATNHGDIFSIWGARCTPDRKHPRGYERCLPSENRCKGGGEWNHYKIICNNGTIKLHVNGKEVSGISKSTPRKGYLALESEGAECHFRNLKIKELPSTNPKPEEIADVWQGHGSIFDGLSLKGWQTKDQGWSASGGNLRAKAAAEKNITLETTKKYTEMELLFDLNLSMPKGGKPAKGVVEFGSYQIHYTAGSTLTLKQGDKELAAPVKLKNNWNRIILSVKSGKTLLQVNGTEVKLEEVSEKIIPASTIKLTAWGEQTFRSLFVNDYEIDRNSS